MSNDLHEDDSMVDGDSSTASIEEEDDTIDASCDTSMDESDTCLTGRRSVSDFFSRDSRLTSFLDTIGPPTPLAISHSDPPCGYEEEGSPYKPPTNTRALRTQSMKFVSREDTNFLGSRDRGEPLRPLKTNLYHSLRGESSNSCSNLQYSPSNQDSRYPKNTENKRTTTGRNKQRFLTASSGNIPAYYSPNTTQQEVEHPLAISKQENSCDFVSANTVAQLTQGKFPHLTYQIIDCRYAYEYEGGHIKHAKHVAPSVLDKKLKEIFTENLNEPQKTVIIFHCEFSSKRGPAAFKAVRENDRKLNQHRWPHLFYPFIYVMEGGYKDFYNSYRDLCEGEYIEMKDKKFSEDLKRNLRLDGASSLNTKNCKISRSNSLSFTRPRAPLVSNTSNVDYNYFLGASSSGISPVSCRSNLTANFTDTDERDQ